MGLPTKLPFLHWERHLAARLSWLEATPTTAILDYRLEWRHAACPAIYDVITVAAPGSKNFLAASVSPFLGRIIKVDVPCATRSRLAFHTSDSA